MAGPAPVCPGGGGTGRWLSRQVRFFRRKGGNRVDEKNPAMAKRTATILGGNGFLGQAIARQLAPNFECIRLLSRSGTVKSGSWPLPSHVRPSQGSVLDPPSVLAQALEGSSVVVNCVGILQETHRQSFLDAHVTGTRNATDAAMRANVERFIQISALGADARSSSVYQQTKAAAEEIVRGSFGARGAIIRPSVIFGANDSFLNRFAGMLRLFPVMALLGGGKTRFQPVFVDDVAKVVWHVASAGQTGQAAAPDSSQIWELGGPDIFNFRELIEMVESGLGRRILKVSVPFAAASVPAFFLQFVPNAPLTPDQIRMLQTDNVVHKPPQGNVLTFGSLLHAPASLADHLADYPWYRHRI